MAITIHATGQRTDRYDTMTTMALIRGIVDRGDIRAFDELVGRPMFEAAGQRFNLPGLLNHLRREALEKGAWKRLPEEVDMAYDLTLDKLCGLSTVRTASQTSEPPDSVSVHRGYYQAFLGLAEPRLANVHSQLDQESLCHAMLKGFVIRQFKYSCLEAVRRALPYLSRYNWIIGGRTLCVSMPITMKGAERRSWLEKNIPDVRLERAGERERVQAIVDRGLVFGSSIRLDEVDHLLFATDARSSPAAAAFHKELSELGLAETLASEKAERIENQRPSIRRLGKVRLREFVRRIFEDIADDEYNEAQLAAEFGLSKATLSRFAGKRWFRTAEQERGDVPDLWRNAASVVVMVPEFVEAARDMGVWPRVKCVPDSTDDGVD